MAGVALVHLAVTSPNGDVAGGWTLNYEHMRIGITRTLFPFFAGLLISRIAPPTQIKHAFFWSGLLLAAVLLMPRFGDDQHLWINGLFESFCIIIVFPLIVYIGANAIQKGKRTNQVCRFLGDLSYPLYMTHYVLVYFYVAWVSDQNDITLTKALPYALLTFAGALILAYVSLRFYDEPVRAWLRKKFRS